jgi:8-oxo-dGTP pyrophosphatase MutT (NUDIX family)
VEEKFGDLEEKDGLNEVFWQRFAEVIQDTFALLREMAEEAGIDLDQIDSDAKRENEDPFGVNSLGHLLAHASEKYAQTVEAWFQTNEALFHEKEEEWNRIRLVSSKEDPAGEAIGINDATEVIRWYQYQICVKLKRAIESGPGEEESEPSDFPKDTDGSAKVALIGIDRSISAWKIFLSSFGEQKRQIVNLIASLENIKNRVEKQFPQARAFVRPGFDEIVDRG